MTKKFFNVRHIFLLVFLLLAQSQLGFGQDEEREEDEDKLPHFTSVSSLFFQPGTDYTVFFTVDPHPSHEPLQLKCVLMANSNHRLTIETESIFLLPGESGNITIPLPRQMPENKTTWRLFTWSYTSESSTEGYKEEAPHTLITSSELPNARQRQSLAKVDLAFVFIETDKPAYKPDDLVRIRVITMGSDDLPHLTAGVNLTIIDSQGNVMKKWEQPIELPESTYRNGSVALFGEFQKKKNGLSAYKYQLSSEPILGNWTIKVEAGSIKEKVFFDVKKYILPKFQVKIYVSPVLYGTGDITSATTFKVSYTYGKGLQGSGTVTVTSAVDARPKIQQFVLKNGEAMVPLKLSSPRGYRYTDHTITANVTEKNTGRWRTGTATVRIFPEETYFIQWINKPSFYKLGLPITVQLKITGDDGFPVKEVRSNALRITFPSSLNLPARETSIPPSGIVTFSFPTPLQPLPANTKFQVQYKGITQDFTLPPAAKATSSGIFIDVIQHEDLVHLIQGNSYNFTIRSNKPIQPKLFHCLLWNDAAMEIHGTQTITNSHAGAATEFPFSLQLPKGAYTDLKVFVYFEHTEGGRTEIISTFKSVNTQNYLKIRVSRPISIKNPAPAAGINNSSNVGIAQANSTEALPPVETTTTHTDTTSTTMTTATQQPDYDDYSDFLQRDDPAADPLQEPLISDKLQVQPGDPVEIHFETYPDSTIAIRGIDQSLLLLTEQDNDLDPETIKQKQRTVRLSNLDKIPTDNSSFFQTFRRLGIAILSNKRFASFYGIDSINFRDGQNLEEYDVAPPENAVDDSSIPEVDSRLRTKFPETWMWEEFQSSNDSSSTVLSKTLPDTLTSWVISGFSLNPKTGLAVASPATITGFMPFFVTLNLPYSVMKLETFDLQVIVHNYLDRDVNVYVTLFNKQKNSDFSFVDDQDRKNETGTRYIKVNKNHVAVAHFLITPSIIGDIPIHVRAVTEDGTAGDSMIRPLKVKPDGKRETRSQFVVFNRSETGGPNLTQEGTFDVEFPKKNVVKGANSLQLTVIGNPMGTMISNLDRLLRRPGGCGEQNMMKFVPNILALNYLTATKSDDKIVRQQARTHLEKGYGHQLHYRKKDGSFAVWAQLNGTTWLTSYVLRWFVEAQKHITINPRDIKGAAEFLLKNQREDGSFVESGPRYHPEMYSESGSSVALSAYITFALIKADQTSNNDLNLKVAIQNGMRFISSESVYQLDDNYITNLVTATLIAGNHSEKDHFFEKMEEAANTTITKDGVRLKYWGMKNSREWASDPLAIEMTSYALLAHLWRQGKMDDSALSIQKWLIKQRNPKGGFISTQDTAMGLTALTAFAVKTLGAFENEDKLQLNIRASSNSYTTNDTELSLSIGRWNRMVLQEFSLPVSTKGINLYARGRGPALIQMTETWYVPVKNRVTKSTLDYFNITAQMTIPDQEEEPTETELELCANTFSPKGAKDSIASINLPSGYIFEVEDYEDGSEFMASRPRNIQRFELTQGNTKMDIYYTQVPAYPPTCITLAATQQMQVANLKKPSIVVYEYLNPALKGEIMYIPAHNINACQLCQATDSCKAAECQSG